MAFEIPLDIAYFGHPKTLKLISILGRVEADVYPLRLWAWAAQYARDGQLPTDCRVIERGLGWKGGSGRLVAALLEAGFLAEGGRLIHDWAEHTGRAIAIYERKKQKQREKYENSSGRIPEDRRQNSPNPECPTQDKKLNPTDGVPESIRFLAKKWADGPGLVKGQTAVEHIKAAVDVGVSAQDIDQVFSNHEKIKGLKIWDVLDPMRPDQRKKQTIERRDASGPRKII